MDITISTLFQNLVSFLYCLILSLFIVKPKKIIEETSGASFEGFLWVTLLGVLSSNVAIHCYMYMIEKIGAVRTNFVPFGQIIIGVLLGIFWLKEWSNYKVWEIVISILGLILIFSAILFGFFEMSEKEEEEEVIEPSEEKEEESGMTGPAGASPGRRSPAGLFHGFRGACPA